MVTVPERVDVAIVGAGPVGLLLACELGLRGVRVLVVGDAAGTSVHPKANTHAARSMEIYRRHGISQALRACSPSKGRRTDVAYYTHLLGYELHRVSLPSPEEAITETLAAGTRWPTPEPQFRSPQLVLEPLLLARAREFPSVEVRFEQRAVALVDRGASVDLVVETAGEPYEVEARFVVGCDGGRSFVRRAAGISFEGEAGLQLDFMGGQMRATYFHAPGLQRRLRHPHAWQNWFILPHLRALMLTLDTEADRYLLHYQLPADPAAARAFQDVLDEVVGEPVEAEILSAADWRAGIGLVARQFRRGNCFIAGDAAHLFTPTGGFGLNTGIDDAFNLGWKLAAALAGWAGERLLDSYALERKPIAERNVAYALTLAQRNGACPVGAAIDDAGPEGESARLAAGRHLLRFARWEYDTPGIQLGAGYRGSPIIVDDGSPEPPDSPIGYVPNAVPGSRLPHAWLPDGSALFDRLGREFVLLCLADGADGAAAWEAAAAARGIPLEVLHLPGLAEVRRLLGADLLLVRPDQYVAWRGGCGAAGAALDAAVGRLPFQARK